ncbi:MAG: acyltransferase family protein [Hyphomonas sp.]
MKSGYILPLDGLRAVAILLVLVFHLDHNLLPGGFIGVDIFFVISGFIITRNILAQREEGTFSFMEFYKRRFVRLFPASAVAVLFTIFGATLIYDAETVAGIGRTALYALLSVANIWFWLNSGYFEDVSSQNPLLHMWSLSVEEQFYLVWPALLMVVSLLPGKKTLWLWLVFVVGLIGAWWLASLDPSGAFYLMPARIFQFAIGAALAAIAFRPSAFVSGISLLSGFVLIGISAAFANGELYEFFIAAVVPTFGAALAIFGLNNRLGDSLLGNVVMRAIGLRAYSIYLVHWPIAVFAGTLIGPNRSLAENFALLVLCLIAGDVLYRMVEKPLRLPSTAPTPGPDFSGIRVSTTLLLLAGGLAISAHTWALNRTGSQAQPSIIADAGKIAPNAADPAALFWAKFSSESRAADISRLWNERSAVLKDRGKEGCALAHKAPFSDFPEKACRMQDTPGKKYLLIGDSLAAEALLVLEQVIPADKIAMAATPGCLPEYPEPGWDVRPEGCQELNVRRFEWIGTDEYSGVIMAANWRWTKLDRFERIILYLKEHGKPVIVMGPRPQFSEAIPGILTSVAGKQAADDLERYFVFDFRERSRELQELLERSGIDYVYVPWGEMLCPDVCRAYLPNGELVYLDQMHIPPTTARWLGTRTSSEYGPGIKELFDF